MKLYEENPVIARENLKSEMVFGVSDLGLIFDILRNKLYSDKIGSICREYMSNARDAHREVGKNDPIKVILPNSLDLRFRVIDYGPGISPERMENIFTKYAGSTKRHDNVQTGGFGIGGKSGFSYSDSFAITTIVDGVKYSYTAYIDETKVGKLALLNQINTDEPNGTEICIPVLPNDCQKFNEGTEIASRWWDIQPIISGGQITSKLPGVENLLVTGKTVNYQIYISAKNCYSDPKFTICVDGIPYVTQIPFFDETSFDIIRNGPKSAVLHLGNGEISLTANREAIQWDDRTSDKIRTILMDIISDLKEQVFNLIETKETYNEALSYSENLEKALPDLINSSKQTWRGKRLYREINIPNFKRQNVFSVQIRPATAVTVKDITARTKTTYTVFSNALVVTVFSNALVVIDDTGSVDTLPMRAAAKIFNIFSKITEFYFITPEQWENFHELQEFIMNVPLSALKLDVKEKKKKTRRVIYRCNNLGIFEISSLEVFNRTNNKLWVLGSRSLRADPLTQLKMVPIYAHNDICSIVSELIKDHGVSVFGVDLAQFDENYKEYEDECNDLYEFMKCKLVEKYDIDKIFYYSDGMHIFNWKNNKNILVRLSQEMSRSDPLLSKMEEMILLREEYSEIYGKYKHLLFNFFPEKKYGSSGEVSINEMNKLYNQIISKYPLLQYVKDNTEAIPHISDYVRLMDRNTNSGEST